MSINQGNSNVVTTNQLGIHENLTEYLDKYTLENYQRPLASFSRKTWEEILEFIGADQVIFDLGCGVGKSSFVLGQLYPNCKIIGIDKSLSRLARKNDFKQGLNSNIKLFRGELLDLIPLIYQHQSELKIKKVFILYPNPWPKKHHIKRRFHASPVSIFLYGIKTELVFRSNWKLYLEEAQAAAYFFSKKKVSLVSLGQLELEEFMTPFEKKFVMSNQDVFELTIA
jgi:tRNA (guanine-N7-)-methyltransferase